MVSVSRWATSQRERVRLLFKVWSRVYDSALFQAPFFGLIHRRILARAALEPPPQAVLDVGCGTGELLRQLAHHAPEATLVGLDLSPEMLARARRKLHPEREALTLGNVYELPFASGSFDLITSTISSHYYLEIDRALSELARVCRPGGVLLIASMTNGPLHLLPGPWRSEVGAWNARFRSPPVQRAALEAAGFSVEHLEPLVGPAALAHCRRLSPSSSSDSAPSRRSNRSFSRR